MANQKITDLDAITSAEGTDVVEIVSDPGGSPVSKKITVDNLFKRPTLTNLLSNSGFGVWSNGTLADYTDANTGFTNLEDNGSAWTGATGTTPPTGWVITSTNIGVHTITDSGDGAPYDVCLKLEVGAGGANPGIEDSFTTVVGKLYKFSMAFKHGTATNLVVNLGTTVGEAEYKTWTLTDATWTTYTHTFIATTTTTHLRIRVTSSTLGQYELVDTVTLSEVTPGCVGADAYAPDGMSKTTTLDLHREYGSSYISGLYGVKATKGADTAEYLNLSSRTDEAWYRQFRGRTVTVGLYVYSVTATDNVKLQINDSDGTTESSFVGAGALTWVEVTRTVGASITSFTPRVLFDGDTADVAYVSKPMLVYGSSIGEGNYQPIPQEVVNTEIFIPLGVATSLTASGILNLEALSSGKIPKGAKAIKGVISTKNSSAGIQFSIDQDVANAGVHYQTTQVANTPISMAIDTKTDSNGDVYVYFADGNFSGTYIYITAVQVN